MKSTMKGTAYLVPANIIEEFYKKFDEYGALPKGQDGLAKYRFWKFLYDNMPELDPNDNHRLDTSNIMQPVIRVVDQDDEERSNRSEEEQFKAFIEKVMGR